MYFLQMNIPRIARFGRILAKGVVFLSHETIIIDTFNIETRLAKKKIMKERKKEINK